MLCKCGNELLIGWEQRTKVCCICNAETFNKYMERLGWKDAIIDLRVVDAPSS